MSSTRSGKHPIVLGDKITGKGSSPVATAAEEKWKAVALRKQKENEKADELELQKAMEAAALKEAAEGEETETVDGSQDGTGLKREKSLEDSLEKKQSKPTIGTLVRSLLKTGRYARPSTPGPTRMHLHEHERAIIEAGLMLDSTKRFEHLVSMMASLIKDCRSVDEFFSINPIFEGGRNKDWSDFSILPSLMTELGEPHPHVQNTSSRPSILNPTKNCRSWLFVA